jgi:uncharacterized membrane protein
MPNWLLVFFLAYGAWVILPWLAPVLMHYGRTDLGKAIYFIYSVFCHQLPERSFFLFGRQSMYSLAEIQAAWQNTLNPMILRSFIGNQAMGWKVAWSDRMVSFYTSIWLMALIWWPLRHNVKPLPWWGFALLLLPMILDGGTHAISDLSGIGRGFRDTNAWLNLLPDGNLPLANAGDALGSFNSWARLITGLLAGAGIAWFAFPHLERSFAQD